MISAQNARKQSESYSSKWTIWDTIQERKINRLIKSALKNQLRNVEVYNLRQNVERKLIRLYGYGIRNYECFGLTRYEIKW